MSHCVVVLNRFVRIQFALDFALNRFVPTQSAVDLARNRPYRLAVYTGILVLTVCTHEGNGRLL